MGHRDSPGVGPDLDLGLEPGPTPGTRPDAARRLAGLVRPPSGRRVALPRLAVAGGVVIALCALVAVGGSMLLRSATRWVDGRPEHRIAFSAIELSPEPDPWVVGRSQRILDEVRAGANLGETISLLDLDLTELAKDFRRCFWVKDVIKVDRSHHGRLIVTLEYRKPVAVVEFPKMGKGVFVLDDEAVVLPDQDIEWGSPTDPYRVLGMASPLIKIKNLPNSMPPPRFGLPWKRIVEGAATDDRDPMILRAARLARFLQDHKPGLKPRDRAPDFVSIYLPDGPAEPFFLLDSGQDLVSWGKAPGDEKPGEPSSEDRWRMLLDWVQAHGPLVARHPDFLYFTATSAQLHTARPGKSD